MIGGIPIVKILNTQTETEAQRQRAALLKQNSQRQRTRLGFALYCLMAVIAFVPVGIRAAAAGDPIAAVNNLSDFIFGMIKALGTIMLGFGALQEGLAFKSHDAQQRANGLLTIAGGLIVFFAKEIVNLISA